MYERKFTLVHIVKNFSELVDESSEPEIHYGVPWCLNVMKKTNFLPVYLQCQKKADANKPWSIDASYHFILASDQQTQRESSCQFTADDGYGFGNLHSVDKVVSNYLVNGCLTVECHVTITRMVGFALKRKINFEEAKESWTDGVLKIGEKTFNVNKRLLAFRSTYFDTLFFGPFDDSKKPKVELEGVDPDFFQNLLDIIYGESSMIQMENVEGVLTLADQFDVTSVRDKCVEFLGQANDGTDNEIRLRVADKFDLEEIKEKVLNWITSARELKKASPADPSVLKPATLLALYKKSLSYHP